MVSRRRPSRHTQRKTKKSPSLTPKQLLADERGSYLKKWTAGIPIGLIYPNRYEIGMSNLGFQLVYSLINKMDNLVCERFFLPLRGEKLRSFESGRTMSQFSLLLYSASFEDDYPNLVRILHKGKAEVFAHNRQEAIGGSSPLVIGGGVATFLNPEPLASFTDLFVIGEAEVILVELLGFIIRSLDTTGREKLLKKAAKSFQGCYVPALYHPIYDENETLVAVRSDKDVPARIKKVFAVDCSEAAHSQVLTPHAEFSDLYLTELGRGCSRGCRFCAAGFIYRPPRLWDSNAVIAGLAQRPDGIARIGLLGMEMADHHSLSDLSQYLLASGCSLSFSSLRADRISGELLDLLGASGLKSVAIAPDGASERLRRVINKGMDEQAILQACRNLAEAGLYKLKIYLMIGLPTEEEKDLDEMLNLIRKIKSTMDPAGKERGRLCEITLSVNCFIPKPWTPFQYHCFGVSNRLAAGEVKPLKQSIAVLKSKIGYLRDKVASIANVRLRCDNPEKVVFQAVLAKGDRRLGEVLFNMAARQLSWKQAMKLSKLSAERFVVTGSDESTYFPWSIIDHGINMGYLYHEYVRSFAEKITKACDTEICKSCGVCGEK